MPQQQNHYEYVFGGTFDPVHNGHLAILKQLNQLAPEVLIRLVPCAVPALKTKPSSDFAARVDMLKLAIADLQIELSQKKLNFVIDEREKHRQGASFTFDTLASLKQQKPSTSLIFVLGTDSLLDLPLWHRCQELPDLCHLLVLNRPGIQAKAAFEAINKNNFYAVGQFLELCQRESGSAFLLKMPEKEESSTQIRQFRRNNLELDSMLPQSVIKYIHNNHLYE